MYSCCIAKPGLALQLTPAMSVEIRSTIVQRILKEFIQWLTGQCSISQSATSALRH